ncbi:protein disulfide oxidoreductase [Psychrobacter sp. FDAARGOS_221]|uniref:protein disulfide oxidoreductase n=1 Tax=Psychrobacter sp. FDAARGOS_221 TaxID=1975705 RepID=UPI000BB5995D|nr:protein disulfide oxidoreductase [Psychrobacter sp. FDAARGOS_221]PNK60201.1 protein disulfide oxidoreductase [Psychrobacter sp. FDAARGOS_221]
MSQHDPKHDPSLDSSTNTKPITQSPKSDRPKWLGWVWSTFKYLALFLVIYTAINWWRQPVMPADPQLQLTDYQGQMVDLEQLSHDSPVLVYFWGTWCGVCKVTSPTINALAEDSDYPIVTIAIQSGDEQTLQQYMTQHDYHFTTINDPNGDIFQQWQGQVTPSFVILKDGEMTQGLTGIQPKWSLKLRLWLSALG